jgi:hypothetical protein
MSAYTNEVYITVLNTRSALRDAYGSCCLTKGKVFPLIATQARAVLSLQQ